MEFVVLKEEEYRDFYNCFYQASFMQSIELSNLKKEYGSIVHLVGVKANEKVIAAAMILEDSTILNKKIFYSPRGLMVDYDDKELLSFFVKKVKEYIKSKKGFILTIDPNVVYRIRNKDGEIEGRDNPKDEAIDNLNSLGFKHHGFNIYLDAMQARWCYMMELDEEYEAKKANFSKSTKKNIESCIKKGLLVRKGTINDLDVMTEIFDITSKRKDFFSRSLDYYKKMYKHMGNLMTIYIAYLDPEVYYNHTKQLLDEELLNNNKLKAEPNPSSKMLNKIAISDKLIEKYEQELKKSLNFKEKYPKGKDIGCLLSIRSGNEYLTLSSGVLEEYRSFTPKYLMYEHHIKDAYQEGFKFCNFYGITGDFNKESKYYGIYEFKKGFDGYVIEYIGEFDLKISGFYYIYKLLKKIRKVSGR